MKNFLKGLAIGLPVGMLLSDVIAPEPRSQMAEQMRDIWTEARARAAELTSNAEDRAREEGKSVSDLVDRQAAQSRERASAASEAEMEQGGEAALNQVTRDELLAVYGIGPALADRILEARPYTSDYDVVELEIVNDATFELLCRQVLDRYRRSA